MARELLQVETWELDEIPKFTFSGKEQVIYQSPDTTVSYKELNRKGIYQITYHMMPSSHQHRYSYLIYDLEILASKQVKAYQYFDAKMEPLTLGKSTYEIGLLFSEGRVFAENHLIGGSSS